MDRPRFRSCSTWNFANLCFAEREPWEKNNSRTVVGKLWFVNAFSEKESNTMTFFHIISFPSGGIREDLVSDTMESDLVCKRCSKILVCKTRLESDEKVKPRRLE